MTIRSLTPVVAGVSGSPASARAIEAAAREADLYGLPLRLVHSFGHRPDRPEARDLLRQASATVDRVTPGLTVTAELIEGQPLAGLLRLSRQAALTVVGDGDLGERVCLPADATAVQLAARASGNVMVTRAAPAPYGPVLVGVNGPGTSEAALDLAFDEAARRRSGLVIVHVGKAPARVHEIEEAIAVRAGRQDVDTQLCVLSGDPTAVLRRESRQASLIVVGARGEQPYHGMLGSVAQTLLHHGRGPIIVVHGAGRLVARTGDAPVVTGSGKYSGTLRPDPMVDR
ncbi:universal stress protein [Actinoplanes sp. NPDC020271]|uniref:universal stress protein n=1 Tax=Actinoplanes sp. NPDC020271 TaxID=3363896 RepID=UPI0037A1281F